MLSRKDDHELMVESLIDEQKQKLEERSAIAFRFKNELSACLSLVTTPSGRKKMRKCIL